jgi:MarR family multiple antibiotic resistance transcriptional regulator
VASRLLSNILVMRFQEADIDMTAEQWGAIIVLLNGGAMTQVQLGERLYLEKSSVSRLVNGLEKRGWIERTKDPKDSRQKLVTPIPQVLDTAERGATIAGALLEEAQLGMTEDEMLAFRSLLSRTITNLRELTR